VSAGLGRGGRRELSVANVLRLELAGDEEAALVEQCERDDGLEDADPLATEDARETKLGHIGAKLAHWKREGLWVIYVYIDIYKHIHICMYMYIYTYIYLKMPIPGHGRCPRDQTWPYRRQARALEREQSVFTFVLGDGKSSGYELGRARQLTPQRGTVAHLENRSLGLHSQTVNNTKSTHARWERCPRDQTWPYRRRAHALERGGGRGLYMYISISINIYIYVCICIFIHAYTYTYSDIPL